MAGPNDISGANKTSVIDDDSLITLDKFFEEYEKRQKKANDEMKKGFLAASEAQKRFEERWRRELAESLAKFDEKHTKAMAAYEKQMLEEYEKEKRERELKVVNAVLERQAKESTKSFQQQRRQQAINNMEINRAMLQQYARQTEPLTEAQEKDKALREQELKLGQESLKAQYKTQQLTKALNGAMNATLNAVNSGIQTYVKYQAGVNTRLQGYNSATINAGRIRYGQNTFGILENRLTSAVGVQPYVRTDTMLSNLSALVHAGIAANVEQRAFLESVKDNIAETFEVANSSLLRIVRLQQMDSSAARLGMEAYLTRFLNGLVSNTEYLSSTFDDVQGALLEASSQMSMRASTEFEYVVQKWLGALVGTGLDKGTAQGIAQAIGYLGSGNISALNNSSMQNLLVMAASRSGLNYSDMLRGGLNASSANQLMNAIATYMVELGSNSNNVVRSQLAQAFGLNISDLTAATQLRGDFGRINKNMLSNLGMYDYLNYQMNTMPGRLSMSQMIQNVWDNSMFSLASGIAGNPALAALWQVTDMIQSTTGGINIPEFWGQAVGTGGGFSLNTTMENLAKLGIVGISSLGMIGDIISGLGSSLLPGSMLGKLGIFPGAETITRGLGLSSLLTGLGTSVSTFVGNSSGNAMYETTMQSVQDQGDEGVKAKVDAAKESADKPITIEDLNNKQFFDTINAINTNIANLYDLASGRGIKVDGGFGV